MSDRQEALVSTYRDLGVGPGRVVLVAANFASMMERANEDKHRLLDDHLRALQEVIGSSGAVVVPTATLNLCNTSNEFDPETTPSHQMGAFSEFVRRQPASRRSFHPFWSVAALGGRAAQLVDDVPRHAFGMNSVWSRLIEAEALSLHIGIPPRLSISITHHIELVCGVPYRYTKEFMHPVRRGNVVAVEPFYHFCCYLDCDIARDKNRRIFENFAATGLVKDRQVSRGTIWSVPMADYFRTSCDYVSRNLYAWLEHEPHRRPYRR